MPVISSSRTQNCTNCHQGITPYNGFHTPEGGYVCLSCRRLRVVCDYCGDILTEGEETFSVYSSRTTTQDICRGCFDNNSHCCSQCGRYSIDNDRCPFCPRDVESYDYWPRLQFYKAKGETKAPYYFGFELEVEHEDGPPSPMPAFVFCKDDGSLNSGYEVVSHPVSPAWIREHKPELKALLTKLKENGAMSYNTRTCGMHVHVSRTAFDGTFHLFKFLEMFYRHAGWTLLISQRKEELLDRWATCGASFGDVIRKAKAKMNGHDSRYTAVNLENDETVEVRVFRGTLGSTSFFKNLQYVEAIVEFTRESSRLKVSPKDFRQWVLLREKQYPDLVNWLKTRGHMEGFRVNLKAQLNQNDDEEVS